MDEQNSSPRSTTRERPSQRPPAPPKSFDNQGFQSDEKSNSDTNHNHTKEQNSFGVQTTNGKNQYEAVNLELVNIVPRDKRQVQIDLSSTNPYDEYFVPVNEHRKYIRGEKLYVTADKRDEKKSGFKKSCIWVLGIVIIGLAVVLGALAASGVISTTPATQVNDTTISSARAFGGISDYTKENITFVPRTVEGVLKIDNEEYKGYYSDPDSEEYKAFTQTISKALVKALFGDHTLNHSGNNIKLEIINLRNGSIVVTYRIHWTPKQNGMTTDPISYDSLNKVLTKYLNDNRRMLDVYHVAEDGLEARNLIDICKDDHKGCEYGCEFNEETLEFECICPDGKVPSIRENNQCVYPTQNIPYINKTTTSNNKNERTEENKSGFDYEDYLEDNKENNLSFVDKVTFPTLPSTSSTETSSAVASTDIFGLMEKELENESREGGDDTSESTPHLEIQPTPEPQPSSKPTPKPTPEPTPEPTSEPSPEPSPEPTPEPISEPKPEPTPVPFSIIDFAVKSEVKSTQSSNLGNPESNLDPKAEPASGYMREKSTQKAEPKLNTESKPNDHMLFPFERVLHTSENKTERIIEVTTMEDKLEPTPVNFVNPMLKSTTETIDKSSDISSELKDLIGGRESSYKSFVKPKFAIQNNKTEKHKTVNEEDTIEKIVLGNTTDIKQISTESITRPSFMNENDTTESSENMQEEIGDTKLNLPIVEENSESDELFNQSTKEPTTVNDSEMSFTFPINSDETPKIFATSVNEIHRIQNEKQKHDSKNEKVTSFSGSSSEELLTILNASPIKEDNSENEEETTTVTNKVTELKEVITTTLPSTSSITTLHVLKAIEDKISEKINNSTGIDISDNSDEYLTSDIDLTTPAADEYEDSYAVVTDYDLDHHIRVNKHSETTTKITFEKTQTTPASTHESNEYQNRTEAVFKNPTESLPTTTAKNYVPMVHTTSNDTKESSNRTLNPAPVWESTEDVSTTTFGFRNDPYIKHPETSTMNIENVTSIPIENDEYDMSPFLPEIRNNKSLVKILHEGHDIPQTDNPKDSQNEQTTVQMEMNQDLGNDSSTAAGNILTTTEKTWLRSNNSRSFNTYDVTELPESNEFIPVANFSNRVIDSKILTNYRDETHSIKATSESDLLETTTDTESSSSKNKFEYDDFTEHELNMDYLESGTESNNTDDDDEEIRKLLKIAATQDTANATETTNIETDYLENESDEYETTESSVENNTDETTVNSHEHVEPKTKNLETEHGHDNKFSYDVSDLIDSKTRNSSQNESDMVSSSESNLSAPASVKIWSIKDVIESAEKNNEDSKPDQEFSEPVEPLKVLPLNKPAKLAENEDNVVSLSGDKDRENKV